jgi:hypothetical protein
MGDFFGILLFFVFVILFFMIISKFSGMSIGYRNKGVIIEPDNFDNAMSKGRRLVDKNYKEFKEIEEKYLAEYNQSDKSYNNLLYSRVSESINLEESGIDKDVIEERMNQKYGVKILTHYRDLKRLKKEFEELTGRKLNIK